MFKSAVSSRVAKLRVSFPLWFESGLAGCGVAADLREQILILLLEEVGEFGIEEALRLILTLGDNKLDELLEGFRLFGVLALLGEEKEGEASDGMGASGWDVLMRRVKY